MSEDKNRKMLTDILNKSLEDVMKLAKSDAEIEILELLKYVMLFALTDRLDLKKLKESLTNAIKDCWIPITKFGKISNLPKLTDEG